MESFSLRSETRQRYLFLSLLFKIIWYVLVKAIRQEKEIGDNFKERAICRQYHWIPGNPKRVNWETVKKTIRKFSNGAEINSFHLSKWQPIGKYNGKETQFTTATQKDKILSNKLINKYVRSIWNKL